MAERTSVRPTGCATPSRELIKGWEVAKVNEIVAETLHDYIDPVVYEEALALIRCHQANGRDVVIVSASGVRGGRPDRDMLGADAVIASRMEVKDGVYTGDITFYAYGENKAVAIRELAESAATTWRAATPTRTRSPTPRCCRRWATASRSTPTAACVAKRRNAAGGPSAFKRPVALRGGGSAGSVAVGAGIVAIAIVAALLIARSVRRRR